MCAGVLSRLRRTHARPTPPVNLLADFAGGGLMCAMGILLALHERTASGHGQVIDCSMVSSFTNLQSGLFMAGMCCADGRLRVRRCIPSRDPGESDDMATCERARLESVG